MFPSAAIEYVEHAAQIIYKDRAKIRTARACTRITGILPNTMQIWRSEENLVECYKVEFFVSCYFRRIKYAITL